MKHRVAACSSYLIELLTELRSCYSATPTWSYKFIHVANNWNKSEPFIRASAYNTHHNLFETLYPLLLSYVGLQVYLPNYFHKIVVFFYTCFMKLIH